MVYSPATKGEELPACEAEEWLERGVDIDISSIINPWDEPTVRDKDNLRVVAALIRPDGAVENCNTASVAVQSAIVAPTNQKPDTHLYDLMGRAVTHPSRGIYVTGDGRKVKL